MFANLDVDDLLNLAEHFGALDKGVQSLAWEFTIDDFDVENIVGFYRPSPFTLAQLAEFFEEVGALFVDQGEMEDIQSRLTVVGRLMNEGAGPVSGQ